MQARIIVVVAIKDETSGKLRVVANGVCSQYNVWAFERQDWTDAGRKSF